MSKKITLLDFGRLVKPRNISEAFLLCNPDKVDPHGWYYHHLRLGNNKIYKQDLIVGIYGMRLEKLFENLNINSYVGAISSFLVFHERKYKFITSIAQAQQVLNSNKSWSIRAIGIKFYKTYNKDTKTVGETWEHENSTISWFYRNKKIIPIEEVEKFNTIELGDMIAFKKTQAIVVGVDDKRPKRWWVNCSWTTKKVTILSGSKGRKIKLLTNRPFEVIKAKKS